MNSIPRNGLKRAGWTLGWLVGGCALAGALWAAASPKDPANANRPTTSQFRRLTETEYRASIADIFGADIKIAGRFEPEMRVEGLLAAGSRSVALTPGGAEQYESIARTIAAQVVDEKHRARLIGCTPGAADPTGRACASAFFDRVGLRLYRRPLLAGELTTLVNQSLASGKLLGDYYKGIGAGLAAMLVDLPFLFEVDRYVPDPVNPRARTLDAWSRASRLSYLLWNSTPDDDLLAAARSGALMTPAGLTVQVDRMTTSPRFQAGGRAFFDDFLQLDGSASLMKDGMIYPAFRAGVPAAAREQTLRTAVQLLFIENGDYRDLFTTRRVAMDRTLSPLYRLPMASQEWQMVELPKDDPHVGLLTQISFLALHSHPGRTSPTLRGKALREILMCQTIPAPPANVNFAIVQDTSNPLYKTTRERLQAHLDDEECASCHRKMDPIGLTLERFDGAGQYRQTENGERIDTSGKLDKISVTDPVALGATLRDSPAVPRCLVQSAWRYALGRPLIDADRPTLDALQQAFAASGYKVTQLFRSIAVNPAFYSASPVTPPAARTAAIVRKGKA